MIRFLASVAMSVMLTPVSAQERMYADVRAPVNVAANLYLGCLRAKGGVIDESDVQTPNDIKLLTEHADEWCIAWTVIWYAPLMGHPIDTWDETRLDRFTAIRYSAIRSFGKELADLYNARRK